MAGPEVPLAEALPESEMSPAEPVGAPVRDAPARELPPTRPAAPMAVQDAIEQVNQIVQTLREALDAMDEVLETIELAERQKIADEHEIESLRRTLRHLQNPRDGMRSGG